MYSDGLNEMESRLKYLLLDEIEECFKYSHNGAVNHNTNAQIVYALLERNDQVFHEFTRALFPSDKASSLDKRLASNFLHIYLSPEIIFYLWIGDFFKGGSDEGEYKRGAGEFFEVVELRMSEIFGVVRKMSENLGVEYDELLGVFENCFNEHPWDGKP